MVKYDNLMLLGKEGMLTIDITNEVRNTSKNEVRVKIELNQSSAIPLYFGVCSDSYIDESFRPSVRFDSVTTGEAINTTVIEKELSPKDSIEVNLFDGNYLYTHQGGDINSKALNLSTVFTHSSIERPDLPNTHMGGFKTNMHQYLIKKPHNSLLGSKEATYIDGQNRSHELFERWFYENNDGARTYVTKEDVYLDNDQKLKVRVSGSVYEVKYEVVSDDGLSLLSATSLSNYKKISTKKIYRRFFLQLKGGTISLTSKGNGVVSVPHFYLSSSVTSTQPSWFRKPFANSTEDEHQFDSRDTWTNKTYVKPSDVPLSGNSSQGYTFGTYLKQNYDLPIFKEGDRYYVNCYKLSRKVDIGSTSHYDSETHEYLLDGGTRKVWLEVSESAIYEEENPVYQNEDLASIEAKITQLTEYLTELKTSKENAHNGIKNIDLMIETTRKDSARFLVQIHHNYEHDNDQGRLVATRFGNNSAIMSRKKQLESLESQKLQGLEQYSIIVSKINEYELTLANAEAQRDHMVKMIKDGVSDLVIDKEGNALGFDYYGKLIMIQDKFENKIEIEYDSDKTSEKILFIKSDKGKLAFVYNEITGFLEYFIDTKGRELHFKYDSAKRLYSIATEKDPQTKKAIIYSYTTSNQLKSIVDKIGYTTNLTYLSNKVSKVEQTSTIHVVDNDTLTTGSSKKVFDERFVYAVGKTTHNSVSISGKQKQAIITFDKQGKVLLEETEKTITTKNYIEDKLTFEATYDVLSEAVFRTEHITPMETSISVDIISSQTENKVESHDEVDQMYVGFVEIPILPVTETQTLKITSALLSRGTIIQNTTNLVEYTNISGRKLAFPIYVPHGIAFDEIALTFASSAPWSSGIKIAKGSWTIYEYNEFEKVKKEICGRNIVEYLDFVNEKPTRVVETTVFGEKRTSCLKYDSNANVVYSKDHLGNVEETTFNEMGLVALKKTYNENASADFTIEKFDYDEFGMPKAKQGNNQSTAKKDQVAVKFAFDHETGSITSKSFIGGGISNRIDYKTNFNMLTSISHNGFNIKYKRDYLGRKLETHIDGDTKPIAKNVYTDSFTYTENGQSFTNCKKILTTYSDNTAYENIYDADEKLIRTLFYPDTVGDPSNYRMFSFAYDMYGRLSTKYFENGRLERLETNEYDGADGAIIKKVVGGTITEQYDYDEKRRVVEVDVLGVNHSQVTDIDYDSQDRVTRINSNGLAYDTKYDALNRISKNTTNLYNDEVRIDDDFEYLNNDDGPTKFIKEHTKKINGLREDNFVYSYDKTGNITKIISDENKTRYTYDKMNRLIREDNHELGRTYVFTYDVGGNITSKKEYAYNLFDEPLTPLNKDTFGYKSDGHKDRLEKIRIGNRTFDDIAYDEMGRPLNYKSNILEWSKENALKSLSKTVDGVITETIDFTYNLDGIRTSKGSKQFEVIGTKILAQIDGNKVFRPIYLLNKLIGFWYNDGTKEDYGTRYVYSKNIQGDIIAIYDETGVKVASYVYDAWGNHKVYRSPGIEDTKLDSIGNINPFRYRSYYFDTETGLYYLQSRYYDPQVGRFISPDIISILDETMCEANGLNLYMYCRNNPITYSDPSGRLGIITALIVAAIVVVSATVIGGVAGGIHAATTGGNFWEGFGWGALSGFLIGFAIGTVIVGGPASTWLAGLLVKAGTSALVGTVLGGAIVGGTLGALSGATLSIAQQGITKGYGNIDWGDVGWSVLSGFLSGAIMGGIFGAVDHFFKAVETSAKFVSGLGKAQAYFDDAANALASAGKAAKNVGGIIRHADPRLVGNMLAAGQKLLFAQTIYPVAYAFAYGINIIVEEAIQYGVDKLISWGLEMIF